MDILNIVIIILVILIIIVLFVIMYQNLDRRHYRRRYGGCKGTRWGCCPDGMTVRDDSEGTNCVSSVGGCKGTRYGCCPHSNEARRDQWGSNCYTFAHL